MDNILDPPDLFEKIDAIPLWIVEAIGFPGTRDPNTRGDHPVRQLHSETPPRINLLL
jgi:hypothetical protein